MDMSGRFRHVTGLRVFESLSVPKQGVCNPKKESKHSFWCFFNFPESQSTPLTTTGDTEVKHHTNYVNSLATFCNNLYYCFQEVRYAKHNQNYLLITFFRELLLDPFPNSYNK